jgi:hypothetical protein
MNVPCRRFVDTPTEGVGCVVTVSHDILLKFFYFIACSGAVILSSSMEKLLFRFIIILDWVLFIVFILRGLDNFVSRMNCRTVLLLDSELILGSPEDEGSLFLRRCVMFHNQWRWENKLLCFMISDNGKESWVVMFYNQWQWEIKLCYVL